MQFGLSFPLFESEPVMSKTLPRFRIMLVAVAALFFSDLAALAPAEAQIAGAVRRAVPRAAARKAAARATVRTATVRAERPAADRLVSRWTVSRCRPQRPCPLPAREAGSFTGGSYNEIRLGSDTRLYRVYSSPKNRLGAPGERYSYWSRSNATGIKAVIDSAIPASRNGNMAVRQVSIVVPRGTTIYEGSAGAIPRGPVGGGNQIVLDRVRPEWIVRY